MDTRAQHGPDKDPLNLTSQGTNGTLLKGQSSEWSLSCNRACFGQTWWKSNYF